MSRKLFAGLMVVFALAFSASATAQDRLFDDPSATVEGSPVSKRDELFSPSMLRDLRAQARVMELERATQLRLRQQPGRVAARDESRTAFADLDADAAARLAAQQFRGFVTRPAAGPLSSGRAADEYVGQYTAVVEGDAPNGDDGFVVSGHPLRVRDEHGELAPVDLSFTPDATGWKPVNPLEPYEVDTMGDLEFPQTGISVDVQGSSTGEMLEETIFLSDTQPDTDTLVKPLLDGAQYAWQLRSAQSPQTLRLEIALPTGGSLGRVTDAGIDIKVGRDLVGHVSPAVAFDADGQPVSTELRVEGHSVYVEVAHRGEDVAYPLLVDPSITAGFRFTEQGVDAASWPYWETYDNGRFDVWGGDGPYGRGLHIASQNYPTYYNFAPGENAGIIYNAPGQAHIYKVINTGSMNITGEFYGACMVVGIAHQFPGGWGGPNGYTYGESCAPFAHYAWTVQTPDVGTNGNRFIFGAYAYSTVLTAFQMYFKDAEIRMYDDDLPTVTQVNAPVNEWVTGNHTGGLAGYGSDPSTGVKWMRFTARAGWTRTVTNPKCAYGPCSKTYTNSGTDPAQRVPVADLPEGNTTVGVRAIDPSGNQSPAANVAVKVDRTGPSLDFSTESDRYDNLALEDQDSAGRLLLRSGRYTLPIRVTDPGPTGTNGSSGPAALKVWIDGQLHYSGPATCVGCSFTHLFAFDATETGFASGEHNITVEAIDVAGNTSTSQLIVDVNAMRNLREADGVDANGLPGQTGPDNVHLCAPATDEDGNPRPDAGYCGNDIESNPVVAALRAQEDPGAQFSLVSTFASAGQTASALQPGGSGWNWSDQSYHVPHVATDGRLGNLGAGTLRLVIPYDIENYNHPEPIEPADPEHPEHKRKKNEKGVWNEVHTAITKARRGCDGSPGPCYDLLIAFQHKKVSNDHLPTTSEYREAVNAFRRHHSDDGIKYFEAWNEPNFIWQPTSRTRRDDYKGAYRAGEYWATLNKTCNDDSDNLPFCVAVAGAFYDKRSIFVNDKKFIDRYLDGTGTSAYAPAVWSFHPYLAGFERTTAGIQYLLDRTRKGAGAPAGARNPQIWLTEFGGRVDWHTNRAEPVTWAAADAQYVLANIATNLSPRITQMYYYQWLGDPDFDSGVANRMRYETPCRKPNDPGYPCDTNEDRRQLRPLLYDQYKSYSNP